MLLFHIVWDFFSILTATYVLKINVPIHSQSVITCLDKRDACNKSERIFVGDAIQAKNVLQSPLKAFLFFKEKC